MCVCVFSSQPYLFGQDVVDLGVDRCGGEERRHTAHPCTSTTSNTSNTTTDDTTGNTTSTRNTSNAIRCTIRPTVRSTVRPCRYVRD
jgi:hypothetical protein